VGGERAQRVAELLLTARGEGGQPRQLSHDGAPRPLWWSATVPVSSFSRVTRASNCRPIGANCVQYAAQCLQCRTGCLQRRIDVTLVTLDGVVQPIDQRFEVV